MWSTHWDRRRYWNLRFELPCDVITEEVSCKLQRSMHSSRQKRSSPWQSLCGAHHDNIADSCWVMLKIPNFGLRTQHCRLWPDWLNCLVQDTWFEKSVLVIWEIKGGSSSRMPLSSSWMPWSLELIRCFNMISITTVQLGVENLGGLLLPSRMKSFHVLKQLRKVSTELQRPLLRSLVKKSQCLETGTSKVLPFALFEFLSPWSMNPEQDHRWAIKAQTFRGGRFSINTKCTPLSSHISCPGSWKVLCKHSCAFQCCQNQRESVKLHR